MFALEFPPVVVIVIVSGASKIHFNILSHLTSNSFYTPFDYRKLVSIKVLYLWCCYYCLNYSMICKKDCKAHYLNFVYLSRAV